MSRNKIDVEENKEEKVKNTDNAEELKNREEGQEEEVKSEESGEETPKDSNDPEKENEGKSKKKNTGEEKKSEEEYNQLYDKYIRLYSEYDNYRRRTRKEILESRNQANSEMIRDFLTVLDDFERAMENMVQANAQKDLIKGVELIYNKFKKTMEEKGLKEMDAQGKEFDPDFHDALTKIPAPSKDLKGKVVDEVEKGYMLGDRIVRHAKVVVGE